jgi:hypothetical protein
MPEDQLKSEGEGDDWTDYLDTRGTRRGQRSVDQDMLATLPNGNSVYAMPHIDKPNLNQMPGIEVLGVLPVKDSIINRAPDKDPRDMTDQYNTKLTPEEEAEYQKWAAELSKKAGRDISGDTYDYDMRGAFKGGAGQSGDNGHFPDTYKKPGHPTFSDQSIYHGVDGHEGGHWDKVDGHWRFQPGQSNLSINGADNIREYLRRGDPGVILDLSGVPAW